MKIKKRLANTVALCTIRLGNAKAFKLAGKEIVMVNWYVVDKDLTNNTLTVVQGSQHLMLFNSDLSAQDLTHYLLNL